MYIYRYGIVAEREGVCPNAISLPHHRPSTPMRIEDKDCIDVGDVSVNFLLLPPAYP